MFRTKYGYKHLDQADYPQRRNRDFKILGNGTFRGYPKGRNSVPYAQLRHLRGIIEEKNQFVIKYAKGMLLGALTGCSISTAWIWAHPFKTFEI